MLSEKKEFFRKSRPASTGKDGELELPILYFKDEGALLYFTADADKVQRFLPSDKLNLIHVTKKRCVIALAAFNYIHTTIGSYGEFVMCIPTLYDKKPLGPIPLLTQSLDPKFGVFVPHCPVTSHRALNGGRNEWNYPKFISNMEFQSTGNYFECDLSSDGKKIFDVRCEKRGFSMNEKRPLVTLLDQNGELIRCPIKSSSIASTALNTTGAFLKVYPGHPMSDDWLSVKPSKRPFMTQYLNSHLAVLPAGTVLERGIRPYEGHTFLNEGKDGLHTISYNGTQYVLDNPADDMMTVKLK